MEDNHVTSMTPDSRSGFRRQSVMEDNYVTSMTFTLGA
jgi:hypothetical protein